MIFKWERNVIEWIESHIDTCIFIGLFTISLLLRFLLRWVVSDDANEALLPWYDSIKNNGGLAGIGTHIDGCNYNYPYLFLIALMTHLPIRPLYAYKFLSCIFDYFMAIGVGKTVYVLANNDYKKGLYAALLVVVSPVVLLNSSAWAQCDSIYVCFIIWSIYYLITEKDILAFVLLGFAFAFKMQAIFIIPFYLLFYFIKKRFSVLYFLILPIPIFALSIPAFMQGATVAEMINIYKGNTDWFNALSMNYPSFWMIIDNTAGTKSYGHLKYMGIILTVAALLLFAGYVIKRKIVIDKKMAVNIAFLTSYITVYMLPSMHERYGYLYEILALIIVFYCVKTIPLVLALNIISLLTYGKYFYEQNINISCLAIINLIVLLLYMYILIKQKSNEFI